MRQPNDARARRWLRWLVPLVTVVLLALFARSVDWARTWDAIVHADPALLGVATAANLATLVVKGLRWSLFLRAIGIHDVGLAVRAIFAGAALNNVLVANGGDAARVAAVARRANVSSASVLATVAIDRLCDLVTYAVLFVIAAFALPLPPELARWRTPGIVVLTVFAVIGGVLVSRNAGDGRRESGDQTESDATPRQAPALRSDDSGAQTRATLIARARAYWQRLASTFATVSTPGRLAAALAIALAGWAAQWATFHFAARSASLEITPAGSLLALLVVNASFLIRLTPGNVGVFQLLYTLAATSTGLDKNSAVAVAFLISVIQYIPITVIGLLLARSFATGSRPSRVREAARLNPFDGDQGVRIGGEQHKRT